MERWRFLRLALLLAGILGFGPSLAQAAVTVKLEKANSTAKTPAAMGSRPAWSQGKLAASDSLGLGKAERPGYRFIVPHLKVDNNNAFGETTLLAIRNEGTVAVTPEVRVIDPQFIAGEFPNPTTLTLAPREVWPLNLASLTEGLPVVDGFFRGWVRIDVELDEQLSVDYFQIDTAQDFAAGSAPVDIGAGELCARWKLRFLIGGGFSGGTDVTFLLDMPLGPDASEDPASIVGDVFDEAGQLINSFSIWTDEYSLQRPASDLVLPDFNAGSIELRFENVDLAHAGGFAASQFKANGKFSVGLKGVCLDLLSAPLAAPE